MSNKGFEIKILNQLSFPKTNSPHICLLTGHKASVQLISPQCTLYFASQQIAEQAWYGILHKIGLIYFPSEITMK